MPSTGSGSSIMSRNATAFSPGGNRHPEALRRGPDRRLQPRFRDEPQCRQTVRQVPQTGGFPVHFGGVRRLPRSGIQGGRELPGRGTDPEGAVDLLLLQAASGSRHIRLRHAGASGIHTVPPLQLGRAPPGFPQYREGRELPGGHAVHRRVAHETTDLARRRGQPEALLHLRR